MGETFAQKVLARKSGKSKIEVGEIVQISPDVALTHDNTAAISGIFENMGGEQVHDPDMHTIFLDHATPAPTTKHAENHRQIREFVELQKINHFFDVGRGICHQLLVESGMALPGEVVLGSDSHTPHAGVMGVFAAGIGRSEMASIWAIGNLWLRVPQSIKVVVEGALPQGVYSKDLALTVIGDMGADGALYMSVEWHGETVQNLSLSDRAVLTNMATEMGAKNSYIPPDETVFEYLKDRAIRSYEPIFPDDDASYERVVRYRAEDIVPSVACPHTVDNVKPISEVAGTKINQAFLGSCTNARIEDLEVAAGILNQKTVKSGVRLLVIPATSQVYLDAISRGYIEAFVRAGAVIQSPGCGPCMGNHMGVPAIGEVTISTTNRNFQGRMGTKESEIYLASPAVVAASAVAGFIAHPKDL